MNIMNLQTHDHRNHIALSLKWLNRMTQKKLKKDRIQKA